VSERWLLPSCPVTLQFLSTLSPPLRAGQPPDSRRIICPNLRHVLGGQPATAASCGEQAMLPCLNWIGSGVASLSCLSWPVVVAGCVGWVVGAVAALAVPMPSRRVAVTMLAVIRRMCLRSLQGWWCITPSQGGGDGGLLEAPAEVAELADFSLVVACSVVLVT